MDGLIGDTEIRLIKLATRKLLDRFSSLQEASNFCRVKPTNLSHYQSFEHSAFMPVDVALMLELQIGESILTDEIARLHETKLRNAQDRSVRDEALDVPVAVGELLAFVCEATATHSPGGTKLTENEKRRYFVLRNQVAEELRELDEAVEQEGTLSRREAD